MTESSGVRDDRAHWEARYAERGAEIDRPPSRWVVDRCLALPQRAVIVDLAGGSGRHATPVSRSGRSVTVVDFVPGAVAAAVSRGDRVAGIVADARALPLRDGSVDAIICVSFLDRTIFPSLARALAPRGVLIYETFTVEHLDVVARGRARGPRNADYLLGPGELPTLVAPLEVQEHVEGLVADDVGERHVARVVALKR